MQTPGQLGISVGMGSESFYAVMLLERSARVRVRDPHAWPPDGFSRRRPMAGLCAHTTLRAAPPPQVPLRQELCGVPAKSCDPRASSKVRRRRQAALHADPGAVDVPTHCNADGSPRDADVAKVEADSP